MIHLFVSAVFSSILILLVATSTNAGLEEELVFYLSFDNIADQKVGDKSGNFLAVSPNDKAATTWANVKKKRGGPSQGTYNPRTPN